MPSSTSIEPVILDLRMEQLTNRGVEDIAKVVNLIVPAVKSLSKPLFSGISKIINAFRGKKKLKTSQRPPLANPANPQQPPTNNQPQNDVAQAAPEQQVDAQDAGQAQQVADN